jgi:hypothetical protein
MGSYPANRIEWPHMPAIEDYLEARSRFEKVCVRVSILRGDLMKFSDALSHSPQNAFISMPSPWHSHEEICGLLTDAMAGFDEMHRLYGLIAQDQKQHVSSPIWEMGFYQSGKSKR